MSKTANISSYLYLEYLFNTKEVFTRKSYNGRCSNFLLMWIWGFKVATVVYY